MLDGPPIAAGHPNVSCGKNKSAVTLNWGITGLYTLLQMSFVRWRAPREENSSAYCWSDIAVSNLQGWPHQCRPTATHKGIADCVSLDKCLSGLGNVGWRLIKKLKHAPRSPGSSFNGVHLKVLGQHRSTFPLFTLVKRRSGCALLPRHC